jgi:hypothetical protein
VTLGDVPTFGEFRTSVLQRCVRSELLRINSHFARARGGSNIPFAGRRAT